MLFKGMFFSAFLTKGHFKIMKSRTSKILPNFHLELIKVLKVYHFDHLSKAKSVRPVPIARGRSSFLRSVKSCSFWKPGSSSFWRVSQARAATNHIAATSVGTSAARIRQRHHTLQQQPKCSSRVRALTASLTASNVYSDLTLKIFLIFSLSITFTGNVCFFFTVLLCLSWINYHLSFNKGRIDLFCEK